MLDRDANISIESGDNAYFTLRGASVSAIRSIFTTKIYDAIKCSELRIWEIENSLLETTDCLTLNIWRSQPQCGFIRFRIGFSSGISILNDLFVQ